MSNPSKMPLAQLADPEWVAGASDQDFEDHVRILIDSTSAIPDALMSPDHVDRIYSALNLHRTIAEGKLAEFQTEHAQMQQACFARGPAGKKRWFAFEAEWKGRRKDLVLRKNRTEVLLQRVKAKRSQTRDDSTSRTRDAMSALEILAKAIAEHRESIEWAGGESTVSDRALWASLNRARVPHGRAGSVTVRDWLSRMTADIEGGAA